MKLGYVQHKQKNQSNEVAITELKQASCHSVKVESYKAKHQDWQKWPEFNRLLEDSRPGDTVVITELDQISRHYQVWQEILKELDSFKLELEVLAHSQNKLSDWRKLFDYIQQNVEGAQAQVKVKKYSKERSSERHQYSLLARDAYFRRAYLEIFRRVMSKESLRKITKESGAPLATVVRIRKDYQKLKQTILLVATFFMTIISLKMVQAYSSNPFLQLAICGVMTLLIVYFTYSDTLADK
ncbi:recombinase family protein [Vagococcus sp. BWB3-3]|uniref:Recombinase family protein n=1 Tax=Vagococcus allomyrinae TaxID=2794353 RepID=A0A940SYM4_9ENTE|nr:recombinase family protein [Vagococcus allomyrinae]MBP1044621.1 recombinase family protein [Vagococcus allomyrinae]